MKSNDEGRVYRFIFELKYVTLTYNRVLLVVGIVCDFYILFVIFMPQVVINTISIYDCASAIFVSGLLCGRPHYFSLVYG